MEKYKLFVELKNNEYLWSNLVRNAMKSDYSWSYSAKEYIKLYNKGISFKNNKEVREKTVEDYIT